MLIYLRKDGKAVGPYSRAELKDMLKHGEVRRDSPARKEEEKEWATVEKCLRVEKPAASKDSPIPKRFRGSSFSIRSIGSTLGVAAYKKFAATRKSVSRSVSVSNVPETPIGHRSEETKRDMIHGAIWFVGGILAIVLGYVFSSASPVEGLYWIFGGAVLFGAFLLTRGIAGIFLKR